MGLHIIEPRGESLLVHSNGGSQSAEPSENPSEEHSHLGDYVAIDICQAWLGALDDGSFASSF